MTALFTTQYAQRCIQLVFDPNALVRERGLEIIRAVFAAARCEASRSLVNDILYYAFRTTEL